MNVTHFNIHSFNPFVLSVGIKQRMVKISILI